MKVTVNNKDYRLKEIPSVILSGSKIVISDKNTSIPLELELKNKDVAQFLKGLVYESLGSRKNVQMVIEKL